MTQKIFRLSPVFQNLGASLVLVVVLCYIVFILAGLFVQDATTQFLAFLFTFPFAVLGVYWFWRHSGNVILTDDAIIVRHFQFEQRMTYGEVTAFQEKDAHMPPNYVLRSHNRVLKFSRETENFYELYSLLRQRIALLSETGPINLPWVLNFVPGFLQSVGIWVGIIVIVLGGLTIVGLQSSKNIFEDLFFIGLTVILVSGLAVAAALPKLKQKPRELIFTATEILMRPFWGTGQTFYADQIQDILIEEQVSVVRPVRLGWQTVRVTLHPLIIKFRDGRNLIIKESQAWQAGYSPERLLIALHRLYKPHKLGAQLLRADFYKR